MGLFPKTVIKDARITTNQHKIRTDYKSKTYSIHNYTFVHNT